MGSSTPKAMELRPIELRVLIALLSFYNFKSGKCWPSNEALMKASNIGSKNWLYSARNGLQKLGIIKFVLGEKGAEYHIVGYGSQRGSKKIDGPFER